MTEDKIKILAVMHYTDEILELIENQIKNNENTLTQSDLQGAIQAIITKIINEK